MAKFGNNTALTEKSRPEPDGVPDGLIRVEDKLYSAEELAKLHPGGPLWIKVCTSHRLKKPYCMYVQSRILWYEKISWAGSRYIDGLGNIS